MTISRRKNRYACRHCGEPRVERNSLSNTGLCFACSAYLAIENWEGMRDPESVVRKKWQESRQFSRIGRPKKYIPTKPIRLPALVIDAAYCLQRREPVASRHTVHRTQK